MWREEVRGGVSLCAVRRVLTSEPVRLSLSSVMLLTLSCPALSFILMFASTISCLMEVWIRSILNFTETTCIWKHEWSLQTQTKARVGSVNWAL